MANNIPNSPLTLSSSLGGMNLGLGSSGTNYNTQNWANIPNLTTSLSSFPGTPGGLSTPLPFPITNQPINSPRSYFPNAMASTPVPDIDTSIHASKIIPTLQNIVSTVNLGCQLDLRAIAEKARNAEYNPKRFAAVIMRIKDPKTTALIFASGKMVCTGAKSEEQSRFAARKYARIIMKLGFSSVKFSDFKIQNIVGSCDVHFPIKLEGLNLAHSRYSSYEPELFPGLIYRMHKPKIVLLIFVSGKIVLTGAKDRSEIYEAFENVYPVLTEFRKNTGNSKE